ncbi:SDR family oxidoreductase [Chloroflexi bacterium TSY]|nr:SDR family oxidoreductase [Chloroflexi bacterium TSY]
MTPKKLQDKVAIITGAASGIGRATVKRFVADGAHVVASDIQERVLQTLVNELAGHGHNVQPISADVTQYDDTVSVVERTISVFGRLDILVNSAGITSRTVDSEATLEEKWQAVMDVNAKGTMMMCHAAVEAMRQTGSGAIINIASIMGLLGYSHVLPFADGFSPYTQSKGAVVQLTRDLGVRLASEGIRVNAVCPGFVYTALTDNVTEDPEIHETIRNLHPMQRMGQPEEIANVIAFLASDEASFVTAATWPVDGGYTAT